MFVRNVKLLENDAFFSLGYLNIPIISFKVTKKMKKKKNNTKNILSPPSSKRESMLKRRQEQLEKEAKKREKSRNALFRKRVRDASEKKALKTLRTKAYYRFSSEYPSTVSPDGFRENTANKKKLSSKQKLFTAVCCVLIFLLSFLVTSIGIEFSKREIPGQTDLPVNTESSFVSALHISYDELLYGDASSIEQKLREANCNTALFELKSEYGYVYFDINSFVGSSADKKIANALDTVKTLSENGINCLAYISCFKDTAAVYADGFGTLTSAGNVFTDKNNSTWLNPFSEKVRNYLLDIIKYASECPFSYIILDNVSFPAEFSASAPSYGQSPSNSEKSDILHSFINEATAIAGPDKLITICDISGFAVLSSVPNEKYGGKLIDSDCRIFCLDLRPTRQYEIQLNNCEYFNYIENMPNAFILDAGALATKQIKAAKEASAIFAITDKSNTEHIEYIRNSGINNIIFW